VRRRAAEGSKAKNGEQARQLDQPGAALSRPAGLVT